MNDSELLAINEKFDLLFKTIGELQNQVSQQNDVIAHLLRAENASKVTMIKDDTERRLGKKHHVCRICGAEGDFDTFLSREMMQNKRDEFEYFECGECHCLQISEIPDNLGDYYGENYYSYALKEDPDRKYNVPVNNTDKILDVGCGTGVWLVSLADAGYGNLFGCDPFIERDIHYGDRVHIRKCTIHEMEGEGTFDRIRMGDSFEHMTDPEEALKSAAKLLKDDGVIEMAIPTYPNVAFELFGPHWYQLDAPRHIFLHSRKSLEYLADKAGLEVAAYQYNSNFGQMVRSFFYEHGVPFNDITAELVNRFFDQKNIDEFEAKAKECNETGYGDHMNVVFRKKTK